MVRAVADDLASLPGIEVQTTWDARLGPVPFRLADTHPVESPSEERFLFHRLAKECDAALIIAPEFDDILRRRCEAVEDLGGQLLGPSSAAVALCADKLRLAEMLIDACLPTVPTALLSWDGVQRALLSDGNLEFPVVIKPRDGAGSIDVRLVTSADDFVRQAKALDVSARSREFVVQPYVSGRAVSVAMTVSDCGSIELFPPADQRLSEDGRFRYLGGRIPAARVDAAAIHTAAYTACRLIPGLRGYVGIDLVVPHENPRRPMIVEINPRLTTSYLGYRALAQCNLAEWLLMSDRSADRIKWRPGTVSFDTGNAACHSCGC